jgi:hypothetical protein
MAPHMISACVRTDILVWAHQIPQEACTYVIRLTILEWTTWMRETSFCLMQNQPDIQS